MTHEHFWILEGNYTNDSAMSGGRLHISVSTCPCGEAKVEGV